MSTTLPGCPDCAARRTDRPPGPSGRYQVTPAERSGSAATRGGAAYGSIVGAAAVSAAAAAWALALPHHGALAGAPDRWETGDNALMTFVVPRSLARSFALLTLFAAGCGRIGFGAEFENLLVVDVASERMAGPSTMSSIDDLDPGTEGLSLVEALTIAANSPGSDLITFEPASFAGSALALTAPLPAITDAGTGIDGSGATVVIDAGGIAEASLEIAADGALIRGVSWTGTSGPAIRVGAVDGARLIDLSFDAPAGPAVVALDATDLTVTGAEIVSPAGDGAVFEGVDRLTVRDASFTDIGNSALIVRGSSSVSVTGSRFERGVAEMVDVSNSTLVTVADNVMVLGDKAVGRGVRFTGVSTGHIAKNLIDPGTAQLVNLTNSSDIAVEHNILDRGDAGVVIEGSSTRNLVFANIIIESAYDGIYIGGEPTETTVVHNTLYRCASPVVDDAADTFAANNLIADDGFVAPESYDFHLVDGNPAIDAGEDLGYDCVPGSSDRYLGAAPDLGAVETR